MDSDRPCLFVTKELSLEEGQHYFDGPQKPTFFFLGSQFLIHLIPQQERRLGASDGNRLKSGIMGNDIICALRMTGIRDDIDKER